MSPSEPLNPNVTSSDANSSRRGSTAPTNGTQDAKIATDVPTDGKKPPTAASNAKDDKISGAELKKQAKADRAARRAQEKQAAGGATQPVPPSGKKPEGGKTAIHGAKGAQHKGSAPVGQKDEGKAPFKRAGSAGGEGQNVVPGRGAKGIQHITAIASAPSSKDKKHVALFGHLYGQSRRTSVAGAGKEVHPAMLALGLQMSNYVICGSNARCVATLLAFKRVIESYTTPPDQTLTRHLTSHLSPQIDYLKSCRPLSISMGNAIRWLKLEVSSVDKDTPEEEAKSGLCAGIDNYIREKITVADRVIANSAGEKIKDGDVILTFAKSSLVQQTLVGAHARGVRFRVVVVDARPLFEGRHLARALASVGLEVQYSLLHGIGHAIKDASKVFLGAHAMMSNGRLYSRVGTATVAMMAHAADIPVIVCAESIKFTERVALDSIVTNEIAPADELVPFASHITPSGGEVKNGSPLASWHDNANLRLLNVLYDVTPAEYVKMVITEYGSLPPSSVPVVHRLSTNT
ncbi:MAG: Eukaryotic translation initiation factor 2B, subunit 4 delta, 67kDa [Caeruleum heppii]|nr:MAG: Eukaryotic translation initiation factor 2B, subunit 4 delta, 67kDa [Caeruleum heppii]